MTIPSVFQLLYVLRVSPGMKAALTEISCLAFNLSPSRSPEDPVGSFGFGLGFASFGFGLGGALIFLQ